jgi:hypothetical protein
VEDIVEKRNLLNEMCAIDWSLQELKFFAIYLSKINARDIRTRHIKLPLREFAAVMNINRYDIRNIRPIRDSLLQKIVVVSIENGESAFQLFKRCDIKKEGGEWYIEFDAHDDALPLMWEFKNNYVTYKVINILRLKGKNQARMYEIAKQYEGLGEITLPLEEFRKRLGLKPNQYKDWQNFKRWVFEECQKSINGHTDIAYTFEPIKQGRGKTSPVKAVKLLITTVDITESGKTLIAEETAPLPEQPYEKYKDPVTIAFANAFEFRFNEDEMKIIVQRLNNNPNAPKEIEKQINFFKRVNNELNYRKVKKRKENEPIKDELAYTLGIIKTQLNEQGDKL